MMELLLPVHLSDQLPSGNYTVIVSNQGTSTFTVDDSAERQRTNLK